MWCERRIVDPIYPIKNVKQIYTKLFNGTGYGNPSGGPGLISDSMEVRVAPGLYPFMLAMFMCVLLLLICFSSLYLNICSNFATLCSYKRFCVISI
jgi:hypothetical protein